MKYLDLFGKEIQEDQFVLYPVRRGSSLHMKLGIVSRLKTREAYGESTPTVGVLSVHSQSLALGGVADGLGYSGREYTLTCLDQVTVIPPSSIPENIRDILVNALLARRMKEGK